MKKLKSAYSKLNNYKDDERFIDWYCYMEDKWLQNADWEEKLTGVFGSIKNAMERYEAYIAEEAAYLA